MRTHGFRTHVLMSLAAAAGVLVALGMPWYGKGAAVDPLADDSMQRTLATLGRAVTAGDGTSGWHALGPWGTAIAGLAGLAALMSVLCLSTAFQGVAREGLRIGALGTVAVIAWRLVDHPAGEELRHGALVAAGCGLVLASAALSVASAALRKPSGPRFGHPGVYVPPPAPPYDPRGSAPPPGL
jgi:hypothetical protein